MFIIKTNLRTQLFKYINELVKFIHDQQVAAVISKTIRRE